MSSNTKPEMKRSAFSEEMVMDDVWKFDVESIVAIRNPRVKGEEKEVLVKFENLSYRRVAWKKESRVLEDFSGSTKMRIFRRNLVKTGNAVSPSDVEAGDFLHPEWTQVERVISVRTDEWECTDESDVYVEDSNKKRFEKSGPRRKIHKKYARLSDSDSDDSSIAPVDCLDTSLSSTKSSNSDKGFAHKTLRNPGSADRIKKLYAQKGSLSTRYLVKWRGLGYDKCTWEREDTILEEGFRENSSDNYVPGRVLLNRFKEMHATLANTVAYDAESNKFTIGNSDETDCLGLKGTLKYYSKYYIDRFLLSKHDTLDDQMKNIDRRCSSNSRTRKKKSERKKRAFMEDSVAGSDTDSDYAWTSGAHSKEFDTHFSSENELEHYNNSTTDYSKELPVHRLVSIVEHPPLENNSKVVTKPPKKRVKGWHYFDEDEEENVPESIRSDAPENGALVEKSILKVLDAPRSSRSRKRTEFFSSSYDSSGKGSCASLKLEAKTPISIDEGGRKSEGKIKDRVIKSEGKIKDMVSACVPLDERMGLVYEKNRRLMRNKIDKLDLELLCPAVDGVNASTYSESAGTNSNAYNSMDTIMRQRVSENQLLVPIFNVRLRDYQLEGVKWLLHQYCHQRGCILGDEMGLGKTLQALAFVETLREANCLMTHTSDVSTGEYIPHNNPTVEGHSLNPVLIVAPLSTIYNWQREANMFTKSNVVVFHGDADDRDVFQQYEFIKVFEYLDEGKTRKKWSFVPKFHIMITSYECINNEARFLRKIHFSTMFVDEGHRLKNETCLARSVLCSLHVNHRIILTGTPIQNNIMELYSLLEFVQPSAFSGKKTEFVSKYDRLMDGINAHGVFSTSVIKDSNSNHSCADASLESTQKETVASLQRLLRMYLLRREKGDVELTIPDKIERIVNVELTLSQKQYYRALLERNRKFLLRSSSSKQNKNLLQLDNILLELRKTCVHPFLLKLGRKSIYEELAKNDPYKRHKEKVQRFIPNANLSKYSKEQLEIIDKKFHEAMLKDPLINSSGKMVLLHKLLPKFLRDGCKLLIFSQFQMTLNILEEYLRKYFGCIFERVDGAVKGVERNAAMGRFNARGNQSSMIFLLTTRAGGVGINLQAASRVIIFDSDWNPHQDLQAVARAHRLGQTAEVQVYRLITRKSVESVLFERANSKLRLAEMLLTNKDLSKSGVAGAAPDNDSGSAVGENDDLCNNLGKNATILSNVLRNGALHILGEDEKREKESNSNYMDKNIDSILKDDAYSVAYSESRGYTAVGSGNETNAATTGSTSAFATAVYNQGTSESNGQDVVLDVHDSDFWEKALPKDKTPCGKLMTYFKSASRYPIEGTISEDALLKAEKPNFNRHIQSLFDVAMPVEVARRSGDMTHDDMDDVLELLQFIIGASVAVAVTSNHENTTGTASEGSVTSCALADESGSSTTINLIEHYVSEAMRDKLLHISKMILNPKRRRIETMSLVGVDDGVSVMNGSDDSFESEDDNDMHDEASVKSESDDSESDSGGNCVMVPEGNPDIGSSNAVNLRTQAVQAQPEPKAPPVKSPNQTLASKCVAFDVIKSKVIESIPDYPINSPLGQAVLIVLESVLISLIEPGVVNAMLRPGSESFKIILKNFALFLQNFYVQATIDHLNTIAWIYMRRFNDAEKSSLVLHLYPGCYQHYVKFALARVDKSPNTITVPATSKRMISSFAYAVLLECTRGDSPVNQLESFSSGTGYLHYLDLTSRLDEVDPEKFDADMLEDIAAMNRPNSSSDKKSPSVTKTVCLAAIKHYLKIGIVCKQDETAKMVDLDSLAAYLYQISPMVDKKRMVLRVKDLLISKRIESDSELVRMLNSISTSNHLLTEDPSIKRSFPAKNQCEVDDGQTKSRPLKAAVGDDVKASTPPITSNAIISTQFASAAPSFCSAQGSNLPVPAPSSTGATAGTPPSFAAYVCFPEFQVENRKTSALIYGNPHYSIATGPDRPIASQYACFIHFAVVFKNYNVLPNTSLGLRLYYIKGVVYCTILRRVSNPLNVTRTQELIENQDAERLHWVSVNSVDLMHCSCLNEAKMLIAEEKFPKKLVGKLHFVTFQDAREFVMKYVAISRVPVNLVEIPASVDV